MPQLVDPVFTGRISLNLHVPARNHLRPQTLNLVGAVATPSEWARSRWLMSLFLLQDVGGLTESQAQNATGLALLLWARETIEGSSEYNWNVSGMPCDTRTDSLCTRPSHEQMAFGSLAAGINAFWQTPTAAEWNLFKARDLRALARFRSWLSEPVTDAELTRAMPRLAELLGAPGDGRPPPITVAGHTSGGTTTSSGGGGTSTTGGGTGSTSSTGTSSTGGGASTSTGGGSTSTTTGGSAGTSPPQRRRRGGAGIILAVAAVALAVTSKR